VDSTSSLGLDQECVHSYRVGDQQRTVGSKLQKARFYFRLEKLLVKITTIFFTLKL